ncbi:TonB-dependent receptor [Arundinibacter roseus]|nr:TonB-dependent receptor [Arundinibacter roseus]
MKKHLHSKPGILYMIMRVTVYQFTLICFFSALSFAHSVPAQDILKKGVNIQVNKVTLKEALSQIEKNLSVRFAYSSDLIRLSQPVSLSARNESLASVLDRLLTPHNIGYKVINNQILLSKTQKPDVVSPKIEEDEASLRLNQDVDQSIRGRVIGAENQDPLPGVSVVIKGTNRGTVTSADGTFQLTVPDAQAVLVFSFVGYLSQEIEAGNRSELTVTMVADIKALNEVVVVGYGTQRRADVTGALSSVSAKDIKDIPSPSLDASMTGRMPGVYVAQTTGTPGGGLNVRVRGTGSIGAGNEPLYVIDGFPVTANYNQVSNPLNSINPNDIESIEVLKDASATAIYGSRGSNGVVIVTTKSGKSGKMSVEIDSYAGIQNVTKTLDMMNAQEFAQYIKDSRNNAWVDTGGNIDAPNAQRGAIYRILPELQNPETLGEGTNWQDEIYRTAGMRNLQLRVSGGNDRIRFMTSAGYFRQEGVVINSDFERYSFRVNLDAQATKKLKVGVNLTPAYTVSNPTDAEGHWSSGGIILSALTLAPHLPVYDADGNYTTGLSLGNGFSSIENPVKLAKERTNRTDEIRLLATAFAEYELLPALKYKLLLGTDVQSSNQRTFRPSIVGIDGVPPPVVPIGTNATQQSYNWLVEHTLTYTKSFGKHSVNALAGFTSQKVRSDNSNITSSNFPNDLVETLNAGIVTSASTTANEWSILSYLSRINYNYDSRYLLTATLRRDGSSRFGTNNKWGIFPSVSVGWRLSEENFMKDVKAISDLKLRASYGFTGNNFIGNYDHVGLLTKQNYVFGAGSGTVVNGLGPSRISNPDLSWEKNEQVDIGLELGIFQNRIMVIADYYRKITSDLLLNVPTPSLTGYTSARQNIGKVQNNGVELAISTRNLVSEFKWNTDFNISFNRNKVVALGPSGEPIFASYQLSNSHITQLGKPMGSFYGYQVEGIFQTQDEVNSNPSFTDSKPGHYRFADINGDGKLSVDDRTILGNSQPDFIFGLTNTVSYKGFDLSILVQGVQGHEIMNLGRRFYANYAGTANSLREVVNSWKSPQDPGDGKTPRVNRDLSRYSSSNASANISSGQVEDGSFVRIRNVSLGYSVPSAWASQLRLSNIRLYVNLQNPITWTRYSGYNPEVSVVGGSALAPGVDYGGYPIARVVTAGLNLNF